MYLVSLLVEDIVLSVDNNEELVYCLKVQLPALVPFVFFGFCGFLKQKLSVKLTTPHPPGMEICEWGL